MTTVDIGRIVRLQIQRSSLKAGAGRERFYDPGPLVAVASCWVMTAGVFTDTPGGVVLDVHHADHPQSKNRNTTNGISVSFTSHYARMRERFGTHLSDGIAGENILVETTKSWELAALKRGLVVVAADGSEVALTDISIAHPCVEFSRFALHDRAAAPQVVSEALRFLDDGQRGFYARVTSALPQRISLGDRVRVCGA
jgi:hypothetical protein